MSRVILNKKAQKQLQKIPVHIARNFRLWAIEVESIGIFEARKIPGFHDEPLTGVRQGQRSIRLSKSYRAFYIEHDDAIIIEVIEVNKHEY